MVRNHVAQSARGIEVSSTQFHADGFRIRDLHVIDVTAVPDGFEDGIVEAENHDVLDCFLAQVVVDTVNLVLA